VQPIGARLINMFLKINANMMIGCYCNAKSILSEGIENSVI
jgi:hypothetical protein